jgi:hypothetical protein
VKWQLKHVQWIGIGSKDDVRSLFHMEVSWVLPLLCIFQEVMGAYTGWTLLSPTTSGNRGCCEQ